MISYNKVLEIFKKTKINIKNEIVSSKYAVNRISASNITSPNNYPAANNTAFDGFAINSKETNKLSKKNIKKFKIIKVLAAGENPKIKKIQKFSSIEVMTGAIIKKPFDTVIPIEKIKFYPSKKNQNILLLIIKLKKIIIYGFLVLIIKKVKK